MAAKPDLVSLDPLPLGFMGKLAEEFTVHPVPADANRIAALARFAPTTRFVQTTAFVKTGKDVIDALPKLEIVSIMAAGALWAPGWKSLGGVFTPASMISIDGITTSVARRTSTRPTPGPLSGLPRTKANSSSTRGTQKRSCATLAPSLSTM